MLIFLVLLVLLLILLLLYIIYRPPPFIFAVFQRRWPDVLWHVSTTQKLVALTIDDGPSQYTQQILEVLKANKAEATFFIIGSHITGLEDILDNLLQHGCELANHATYDEPARSLPVALLKEQITTVQQQLDDVYHRFEPGSTAPRYYRPGSGFFSSEMRPMIRRLGSRLVLGDVYPHDPQIRLPRLNAWHILSMVRPGSVLICHDCRSWTVPMLQHVLPELNRRGYRVVTVTELLAASEEATRD